jgi:5-methyltetrahydrofolate--homocysteine methyltransferase
MKERILYDVTQQLLAFNEVGLLKTVDRVLAEGVAPAEIISEGLSPGLEIVGNNFEKGEFFLPELMLSGDLMKKVIDKLRPHMISEDKSCAGTVLLGTIEGDIHYIGKNIFSAVLEGDGYKIYDLGVDVPPALFLEKAEEIGPDIIGMSALISVAVSKIAEAVGLLHDNGIDSKILVGGAAVTEENAKTVGADGYAFDAWQGLRFVRKCINR